MTAATAPACPLDPSRAIIETARNWRGHWEAARHAETADDLLHQVERTVGGKPVPPEQICLVVAATVAGLDLGADDDLLDLCCGNGLLTLVLAQTCRSVVAADYSPTLIATARERHAAPHIVYLDRAAEALTAADFPLGPPGKICMNAGLQYFTAAMLETMLRALAPITGGRAWLYLSDVPDADRLSAFCDTPERRAEFERRRAAGTEAIGTWWSRALLTRLFADFGYATAFIVQDKRRLTAHYRFDLRVTPVGR